MISVCKHVLNGKKADKIFAHQGEVIAAFCNDCEARFSDVKERWGLDHMITPTHAVNLGLPLNIPDKAEASVFGQEYAH